MISEAGPEQESQAISLLRSGLQLPEFDQAFWTWRYRLHPAGRGLVLVAWADGQVVGVAGAFPQDMRVEGRPAKGWFVNDVFVHPQWRRQGLFTALCRKQTEGLRERGASLAFCIATPMSYAGYTGRLGYRHVADVPYLVAAVRPSRSLLSRVGSLWPRSHLARALAHFTVEPATSPAQLAEAAAACMTGGPKSTEVVPSEEFFRWRFYQHPWQRYVLLVLRQGQELAGYAVLRGQNLLMVGSRPDRRTADAVVGAALREARDSDTPDLHAYCLGSRHLAGAMRRAGFVRWPFRARPFGLYPQQPLMVLPLGHQAGATHDDRDRWNLQMAHLACGL